MYGTVAVAGGRVFAPSVFSGLSALSAPQRAAPLAHPGGRLPLLLARRLPRPGLLRRPTPVVVYCASASTGAHPLVRRARAGPSRAPSRSLPASSTRAASAAASPAGTGGPGAGLFASRTVSTSRLGQRRTPPAPRLLAGLRRRAQADEAAPARGGSARSSSAAARWPASGPGTNGRRATSRGSATTEFVTTEEPGATTRPEEECGGALADLRLRPRADPLRRRLRPPAALQAALDGARPPPDRVPARGRVRPAVRRHEPGPVPRHRRGERGDRLGEAVRAYHRRLPGRRGRDRLPAAHGRAGPGPGDGAGVHGRDGRRHRARSSGASRPASSSPRRSSSTATLYFGTVATARLRARRGHGPRRAGRSRPATR